VKSITAPDEQTIVLVWKKAYYLANRTFLSALPMMPAKALEGDFDTLR